MTPSTILLFVGILFLIASGLALLKPVREFGWKLFFAHNVARGVRVERTPSWYSDYRFYVAFGFFLGVVFLVASLVLYLH